MCLRFFSIAYQNSYRKLVRNIVSFVRTSLKIKTDDVIKNRRVILSFSILFALCSLLEIYNEKCPILNVPQYCVCLCICEVWRNLCSKIC